MGSYHNKTLACRACRSNVKHFTVDDGASWTAWRHTAPCGRMCDPGGCESLDQGHYGLDRCSNPDCPVVAETEAVRG